MFEQGQPEADAVHEILAAVVHRTEILAADLDVVEVVADARESLDRPQRYRADQVGCDAVDLGLDAHVLDRILRAAQVDVVELDADERIEAPAAEHLEDGI